MKQYAIVDSRRGVLSDTDDYKEAEERLKKIQKADIKNKGYYYIYTKGEDI